MNPIVSGKISTAITKMTKADALAPIVALEGTVEEVAAVEIIAHDMTVVEMAALGEVAPEMSRLGTVLQGTIL